MKKIIFALLLLSAPFSTLVGQKDSSESTNNQFQLYFGVQSPVIKNLNSVLQTKNYPTLNSNVFSAGFGFIQLTKKNFISHQEITAYNAISSNDSVSVNFRNLSFSQSLVGYSYLNKKNFQSYSFMGITYGNSTLKINEKVADETSFDNYSSSLGNQVEITTQTFLLNITTQFNYLINLGKSDSKMIIGFKGSYYMPFTKPTWKTGKTDLNDGPDINPGGFSANLTLGLTF
jgi:hypothetical protein